VAKEAVYFEDLQKTVFIIKVITPTSTYLEQRRWHHDDAEHDFDRFRESKPSQGEQYIWIEHRSELMGVSVDTGKWMDRKWVPAGKAA
jgi:hypothetical protein